MAAYVVVTRFIRSTVPAAGVEPAASAFSARCSHRLSYTGMIRDAGRSRTCFKRVAADRLAAADSPEPVPSRKPEPAVGLEPTCVRLTRAVPGPSSIAGLVTASAGVEPHPRPSQGRVPPAHSEDVRQYAVHSKGSDPNGIRLRACEPASGTGTQRASGRREKPCRSSLACAAGSRLNGLIRNARWVRPLFAQYPGQESNLDLQPSESCVMSVSPPGHSVAVRKVVAENGPRARSAKQGRAGWHWKPCRSSLLGAAGSRFLSG